MPVDPVTLLARATPEGEAEYQALVTQLRVLWPDLEPIPRQPSLSRDIGVAGRADYHADTDTYRTFRVVLARGTPIFILGAYRVRELNQGTVIFIGRLPMPLWAYVANLFGGALVVSVLLVFAHALLDPLGQ